VTKVLRGFPTFNSLGVSAKTSRRLLGTRSTQFLLQNRPSQLNQELRLSTAGDNRQKLAVGYLISMIQNFVLGWLGNGLSTPGDKLWIALASKPP